MNNEQYERIRKMNNVYEHADTWHWLVTAAMVFLALFFYFVIGNKDLRLILIVATVIIFFILLSVGTIRILDSE